MTKEPISPNEAREITNKILPAYFEALNEEIILQFTGMTMYLYDADILGKASDTLNLNYSAVYRRLPNNIVKIVKEQYGKIGWEVSRPEKYKCNEDPHYIFKER